MFIIEEAPSKNQEILGLKSNRTEHIDNLKSIIGSESFLKLESIDFHSLMNKEAPFLSMDIESSKSKKSLKIEEDKFEDEVFKKLEAINDDNRNIQSFLDFLDSLKNEKEDGEKTSIGSEGGDDDGDVEFKNDPKSTEPANNGRKQDISNYELLNKKHKVSDMDWKSGQGKYIRIRSIFKLVYDYLGKNLFDPKWEIRHGACIALRNFIKKDIHKLYVSIVIDRSKLVNVEDQEDNLATFVRDSIKNLTFSNDFFEDFIARQLVVIALDRYMDHASDRTHIIVRENSCQAIARVTTLLFREDPIIYDKLYVVIDQFLRRKEWEIKIGILYLIKNVLTTEKETCDSIFKKFGKRLLEMIEGNDDVLCILAECLEIFAFSIPFQENISFFIEMNQRLWSILEFLDDISLSNHQVSSVLNNLHKKEEFMLLYPNGFNFQKELESLLPLFQHKIPTVRNSVYSLETCLLQIIPTNALKKNLSHYRNLLKLSCQNLMVEAPEIFISNLLKLTSDLIVKLWDFDTEYCAEMLRYLLASSGVYIFKNVIDKFIHFSKSSYSPYDFVNISTDPNILLPQQYERIIKTSACMNLIIKKKSDCMKRIKDLFDSEMDLNHFSLLSYLLILVQLYTEDKNQEQFFKFYDKDVIDSVLGWNYSQLKVPYFDILHQNIRDLINNLLNLVKSVSAVKSAQNYSKSIIEDISNPEISHPSSFERLYTLTINAKEYYSGLDLPVNVKTPLINCIQVLQNHINEFVIKANEFVGNLKILAAGATVMTFVLQSKPLEKLNLILKPVVSGFIKSNFLTFTDLQAFFLYNIVVSYEGVSPSPIPKVFNNLFSAIFDEKISAISSKLDYPQADLNNKHIAVDRDYVRLSRRYESFVELVSLLLKRNGQNLFKNYPFLLESLVSEFRKIVDISFSDINISVVPKLNLIDIYKNLKMMNILRKIQHQIFELKDSSFFIDNLVKALAILHCIPDDSTSDVMKFREKSSKICLKLIRHYLKTLKEMKKEQDIYSFLEKMYKLLKADNLIVLKYIHRIHEIAIEEFIDYTKIFIIQCIKKINTDKPNIRKVAIKAFAAVINGIFIKDSVVNSIPSEFLQRKYKRGFDFVFEFKNNKGFQLEPQTKIQASLRGYQLEGVKWMSFLMKYNMSAALCDDMGLGKTLQTLVVLQEETSNQLKKTGKVKKTIIIVPSSLAEHWLHEIKQFCDPAIIKPIIYSSNSIKHHDSEENNVFIITSHSLSKFIDNFKKDHFFFMILDEAHLIKNPKTKIYKAIKQISAQHKIALTGTPIQNNVAELWSIFDVIMPGYLGDEEFFTNKYSKHFKVSVMKTAAKDMIISSEQDEILEELHRKVKPFIMRRDKMSVLSELPPKVIQDYYCRMTDMQPYRNRKKFIKSLKEYKVQMILLSLKVIQNKKLKLMFSKYFIPNYFHHKMLHGLRKICNHPALFFEMPSSQAISKKYNFAEKDIQSYECSGKLLALKDLFNEMGFEDAGSDHSSSAGYSNNPNKILLFSRYKETLDIISKFLLHKCFPKLNYLRIDGTINASKRFEVVKRFNRENEVKLLLLTTGVGGVGLNLHTANIVVMFDHDYNPMNDLQAIDRAHRIGQKNVLNVYRLIIKDTLEEQIMGIQRFKLNVANSVINMENSSIDNVKQSNLLSLFSTIKQEADKTDKKKKDVVIIDKYSKILEEIGELWDEDQYQKDFSNTDS